MTQKEWRERLEYKAIVENVFCSENVEIYFFLISFWFFPFRIINSLTKYFHSTKNWKF